MLFLTEVTKIEELPEEDKKIIPSDEEQIIKPASKSKSKK